MAPNTSNLIRGTAQAMLMIAKELQIEHEVSFGLNFLTKIVETRVAQKILQKRSIPKEQQARFLIDILLTQKNKKTLGHNQLVAFVELLAAKRRLALIPKISTKYHQFDLNIKQQTPVTVISAIVLPEDYQKSLQNNLERFLLKHLKKQPLINFVVDNTIIAGILIKYNQGTIDFSVKGKLLSLSRMLKNN